MSMRRALLWAASGDTGLSSEAVLSAALGVVRSRPYVPLDTGDLGRCLRLIEAWPAARKGVTALGGVCPVWRQLDLDWSAITASARREGVFGHKATFGGEHPRTYALLRAAIARGEAAGQEVTTPADGALAPHAAGEGGQP